MRQVTEHAPELRGGLSSRLGIGQTPGMLLHWRFWIAVALWTVLGCMFVIWTLRMTLSPRLSFLRFLVTLGIPACVLFTVSLAMDIWQGNFLDAQRVQLLAVSTGALATSAGLVMIACLQFAYRLGFRSVRAR